MENKNCFRCGEDFRPDFPGQKVCFQCRCPKVHRRRGAHLTVRDRQVIRLVAEAKTNKEIAAALHVQENSVKVYLNGIFRILRINNRVALAVWAARGGLDALGDAPGF